MFVRFALIPLRLYFRITLPILLFVGSTVLENKCIGETEERSEVSFSSRYPSTTSLLIWLIRRWYPFLLFYLPIKLQIFRFVVFPFALCLMCCVSFVPNSISRFFFFSLYFLIFSFFFFFFLILLCIFVLVDFALHCLSVSLTFNWMFLYYGAQNITHSSLSLRLYHSYWY